MSKIIAAAAIRGAHACMDRAERMLADAVGRLGRDAQVGFEGTAYALPTILALTGRRVERLRDLEDAVAEAHGWIPSVPTDSTWLPYLGGTLDAGAAMLAVVTVRRCAASMTSTTESPCAPNSVHAGSSSRTRTAIARV